jgi:hypothetical protein
MYMVDEVITIENKTPNKEHINKYKVVIGICVLDTILVEWAIKCLMPLSGPQHDVTKIVQLLGGVQPIAYKRNTQVKEVLKDKEITHIFFLDHDIIPENCNICEALEVMLKLDVPILSGLLRMKTKDFPYMMFVKAEGKEGYHAINKYKEPEEKDPDLIDVDAVGQGFLLVKREVFEKMEEPWFWTNGTYSTEDLPFCLEAKKAGFKIYVTPLVKLSHIGMMCIKSDGTAQPPNWGSEHETQPTMK